MKKSIGKEAIIHPNPVLIVGTYDKEGKPNIMNAAWGGIACSRPPCVSISLRKATHTYGNIVESKAFTINIPSVSLIKEADYAGTYSGKDENKFEALNLTPVKSDNVNAPYIKEFPFSLECKLINTLELGLHTQFIGEIMDIKADEEILGDNGQPDIEKVKPFVYATGNMAYYEVGKFLGRGRSVGIKK